VRGDGDTVGSSGSESTSADDSGRPFARDRLGTGNRLRLTAAERAMDSLHFFVAIGPLAAYAALLGVVHVSRRPFVTSGAREAATLGIALTGVAVAGPLELFLPDSANRWFPGGIWIVLLLLYSLCLRLAV